MRHKKLQLCAILLLGLGLTGLQAQQSVNTAGGNAVGNGGSVSYSLGQSGFRTHAGTNGSVAEGVQQPYEISVVTAIEGSDEIKLSVLAYPNPTTDILTLSIFDEVAVSNDLTQYSYQLLDIQGKPIQSARIADTQTNISMSDLSSATYLLKIISGNKTVKSFKLL